MKIVALQEGGPKIPAEATVGIGPRSEGGFGLEIALEVSFPGIERSTADALVPKHTKFVLTRTRPATTST